MRLHPSRVDGLRLELELAELEAGGHAYGLTAPPDPVARRRDQLPHEAHVDFDAIEADLDATRDRCAALALQLRPAALDLLLGHVDDAHTDPLTTLARLRVEGLAAVTGLPMLVARVTAGVVVELHDLAVRSAARVHVELVASGMPADRIRPRTLAAADPPPRGLRAGTVDALNAQALRVALAPVDQIVGGAQSTAAVQSGPGANPTDVTTAITTAVAALSDRGVTDVANQAANRAGGLGRTDGVDDLDLEPSDVGTPPPAGTFGGGGQVLIYASELIDRSTCYPCALVDGTEYDTEAAALDDYPFGQYAACLGGGRCRGMLVYVWSPEAEPSIGMPR